MPVKTAAVHMRLFRQRMSEEAKQKKYRLRNKIQQKQSHSKWTEQREKQESIKSTTRKETRTKILRMNQ